MRVAVIGGGPSGLVTLKYLQEAHQSLDCDRIEPTLFESQPQIGGTFFARAYEEAELVSSKQLTTFSDFRSTAEKDFLPVTEYVDYLHRYCTHFQLWPHIRLSTTVISVTRGKNRRHVIRYQTDGCSYDWECDAVAICSGLHVEPNIPSVEGIAHLAKTIHSSQFKDRKQFDGCKTVMILGCGETGADIAYLAVTHPEVESVVLCHRDGFHFAPKRNPGPVLLPILGREPNPAKPGIPIDVSRANLFDTAYVHPILRKNDAVLWGYYKLYITVLLFLSSGTTAGMDQWVGEISTARHHPSKIFFNKSINICPYISLPYRPHRPGFQLWAYALRSALVQTPVPDTDGKFVDLAPWPRRFDRAGFVWFVDNGQPEYRRMCRRRIRPDLVVFCTGYEQKFTLLTSKPDEQPYPTPDGADVRRIWKRDEPSVGFIGFVRPSLGAIPPLAEMQAQLWILNLVSRNKVAQHLLPEDEAHYRLKHSPGARVNYGVDHESYAYQLALDMGSAPGFADVIRHCSIKLIIIWAFGAHFNTKFRLQGPWKWNGAPGLLTSDEFWETITRRPILFGHFAVSILPMLIFGPINLLCFLVDTVYSGSLAVKRKTL